MLAVSELLHNKVQQTATATAGKTARSPRAHTHIYYVEGVKMCQALSCTTAAPPFRALHPSAEKDGYDGIRQLRTYCNTTLAVCQWFWGYFLSFYCLSKKSNTYRHLLFSSYQKTSVCLSLQVDLHKNPNNRRCVRICASNGRKKQSQQGNANNTLLSFFLFCFYRFRIQKYPKPCRKTRKNLFLLFSQSRYFVVFDHALLSKQ